VLLHAGQLQHGAVAVAVLHRRVVPQVVGVIHNIKGAANKVAGSRLRTALKIIRVFQLKAMLESGTTHFGFNA